MFDLTVQQLRMLREVARLGTIAAAADALGYTPSAVSQQIAALERAAGVDVLEKTGRNVRLTDAGRALVGHADVMLTELERAQVSLENVTLPPASASAWAMNWASLSASPRPAMTGSGSITPDHHGVKLPLTSSSLKRDQSPGSTVCRCPIDTRG